MEKNQGYEKPVKITLTAKYTINASVENSVLCLRAILIHSRVKYGELENDKQV